ncbi:hypothetical protein DFH08DRAFT_463715 [Mycena albidolilacea]|uniref:NADH:flavin oxidoreductase/NADH oxidase N-terminal domain-containing protein n=1 Tax=Mycena albidolilacea TaxID=1033008 RepID=A0AAD7AEP2_9AGAR|nr:hypothetical protein DFH08DRAFT_463715 [Mycena albidolilacea]
MPALFNPLQLGSTTISNRIGMSALTRNRADVSTTPNELMKEYYLQRATVGCGLIVNEGTLITRQGTEWPQAPGIWNKEQIAAWKTIVDAVHTTDTKIYCQLWHLGRCSHPDAPEQVLAGVPVYAPSALSARLGKFRFIPGIPGYVTPTAIEDPTSLILLYKEAAINAKEAGFDGVELHGANGYLIHEFLDSTSNNRTDKWGGSAENRSRFGLEVLKAVIEVFGADVAVKLSPAGGYNDMGMPLEETIETYSYFISEADKLDLSYICLARFVPFLDIIIEGKRRAIPHEVIGTYRPLIKNTQVFANGAFTPEEAEELVSAGTLDGVFFGVPWLTHPDLAKRVRHGKPLDNTPDIETFYGHPEVPIEKGFTDYPALASYE